MQQAGRRTVRLAMLASTAMLATGTVAEPEIRVDVILTESADNRVLTGVDLSVDRSPDLFGLAPDVFGFGVLALGGDDVVRLTGSGTVSVRLAETRVYAELPGTEELLTLFFAPVVTEAGAVLADGGAGNDRLTNRAAATVAAEASLSQVDFSLDTPGIPFGLIPVTTAATLTAVADGLRDPSGTNVLRNEAGLAVTATANTDKARITLDIVQSSSETEVLGADARATGLQGGSGRDILVNALGAALDVTADSDSQSQNIAASGITLSEVSTEVAVTAHATGLAGNEGNDSLQNAGQIAVDATADVNVADVILSLVAIADSIDAAGTSEAETRALAIATGLDGGAGRDGVTNSGTIQLAATADHDETGVFIDDGGIDPNAVISLLAPPTIDELATGGAIARVTGLSGDGVEAGATDALTNSGTIGGIATATSKINSIGIGIPLNDLLGEPIEPVSTLTGFIGLSLSEVVAHGNAGSVGIAGDGGGDFIKNSGAIDLKSAADVQATQVNVSVLDWLSDIGGGGDEPAELEISGALSVMTTGAVARVTTAGIAGGDGDDQIYHSGTIDVSASADAKGDTVNIGFSKDDEQISANMAAIRARTSALAVAKGIDAGTGTDLLFHNGRIAATADADTRVIELGLSLALAQKGMTLDATLLDNHAEAIAIATGIASDGGAQLVSNGSVDAAATAETRTFVIEGRAGVLADITGGGGSAGGLVVTLPAAFSGQSAQASARSIDLPMAGAGDSRIEGGSLTATADADVEQYGVQASVSFATNGVAIAGTILDASTEADSFAGLYRGGADAAAITGTGDHAARADAESFALEFQLGGAITDTGLAGGVTMLLVDNGARATSRGFELGGGGDVLVVDGSALAEATASTQSISIGLGAAGTNTGVAVGGALASTDNRAVSDARLVEAGDGDDSVGGTGTYTAAAQSDSLSVGINIGLAGAITGVALGGALVTSTTAADATAQAIDLGDGHDLMDVGNALKSRAEATAEAVNISLGLGVSLTGIGAGAVLNDSRTVAAADASGVAAGDGNDTVAVRRGIDVSSVAEAENADLALTFGAALQGGLAGGFVMSDVTVAADATANGMAGGTGNDLLLAQGAAGDPLSVGATATATRATVQLVGTFAAGASLGGTLLDATTRSTATAVGLQGGNAAAVVPAAARGADAAPTLRLGPPDDDRLAIDGAAQVFATAETDVVEVIMDLQFAVGIGASIYTADNSASATALAMDGGIGADWLEQAGSLSVQAIAASEGPSIAISGLASSMGNVAMAADSTATAMAGGEGDDRIDQLGTIDSYALALATGDKIDIVLLGDAMGRVDSEARATAIGIHGGDGDDRIATVGRTSAMADASTPGYAIGVSLIGQALPKAGTRAVADAIAIETGQGADTLTAGGPISAAAFARRDGMDVAVTLVGVAQTEADSRTEARATGVANAGGADSLEIQAPLSARAEASTASDGFSIGLIGDALSAADLSSTAAATGVASGNGGSIVRAAQGMTVDAVADTQADTINVTLLGRVEASASPLATAAATGVAGGADGDSIALAGTTAVTATAGSSVDAITVSLAGPTTAGATPAATALATGVAAGDGADVVENAGSLTANAIAATAADMLAVTIIGSAGPLGRTLEGDMTATAIATGMDGGAGDDRIEGAASAIATSTLATSSFTFTLLGTAESQFGPNDRASGNGLARAVATGVSGGSGSDLLLPGLVRATATAIGASGATSIVIIGEGKADAGNRLEATATGVDGGAGADRMSIGRDVTASASASGASSAFNVNIIGTGDATAAAGVRASAVGVTAGDGDDQVDVRARLRSTATATGFGGTRGVAIIGQLKSNSAAATSAESVGLDLGAGADHADVGAAILVSATATADAGARQLTIIGGGSASATIGSDVAASGILAGSGIDHVTNRSTIGLDAMSTLTAGARTLSIVGTGSALTGLASSVSATGVDGGADDDELVNETDGRIEADVEAALTAVQTALTIIGSAATGSLASSSVQLVGMVGGTGNDLILNRGIVRLDGLGRITATDSSSSIIGSSAGGGALDSRATLVGLSGGEGNDSIEQQGTLELEAEASAMFSGSSYSTIGSSATGALLGSATRATGLEGGGGTDMLLLAAGSRTRVAATAIATLSSDVEVDIGNAGGATPAGTLAVAIGLDGGDDADGLAANGRLTVEADASTSFFGARFAGLGSAGGRDRATAEASATGLSAGGGDDALEVGDTVTVRSHASALGFGGAGADLGDANAAVEARATARGIGLEGGSGTDSFTLTGPVLVDLGATARSTVSAEAGALWSDGVARAKSRTFFDGALLRDGGGQSTVTIGGTQQIRIETPSAQDGSFASADALGEGIDSNAQSLAESDSQMSLWGVQLGTGTHQVQLNGRLDVLASPRLTARAEANGGNGVSSDATAIADLAAAFDTVVGVDARSGALSMTIAAGGALDVNASPTATASAIALLQAGGFPFDPNATTMAVGQLQALEVSGIRAAFGADRVIQAGTLNVTAAPTLTVVASSSGDNPSEQQDAVAETRARINDLSAIGIALGEGANEVMNTGTINVLAAPAVSTVAQALGYGADGDADAEADAEARRAAATGIATGGGNDRIVNTGSIIVESRPIATATALAVASIGCDFICPGDANSSQSASISSSAWAIRTGGGDDLVESSGIIRASQRGDGDRFAILTEEGNDSVLLSGGRVTGFIDLGSGTDSLTVSNTIIDDGVFGGIGFDTLRMVGAGTLPAASGFERYEKSAAGVFALLAPWVGATQTLVSAGTLRVAPLSSFGVGHSLTVHVAADGSNGRLDFGPQFLPTVLSGALGVVADPGVYTNGQRWDVLSTGSSFVGAFSAVTLPPNSAQRTWFAFPTTSGSGLLDRYRVLVTVQPLRAFLPRGAAQSFAAALDAAAPSATGTLAGTLAAIQAMPDASSVTAAVSAMQPRLGLAVVSSAAAATDGALATMAGRPGGQALAPALGMVGREAAPGSVAGWAAAFDQAPAARAGSGRGRWSGYASGLETATAGGTRLGLAAVRQGSNRSLAAAGGSLESTVIGMTLAAPLGEGRLDLTAAAGEARFDGQRSLGDARAPGSPRMAQDSRGLALAAALRWPVAPGLSLSGGLDWRQETGSAYREAGVSGLALAVEGSEATRTESRLGFAWTPQMHLGLAGPRLRASLGAHWVHRFEGVGERLVARFAGAPGTRFTLAGDPVAADSLALDAAAELVSGHGFTLAATGSARLGDAAADRRLDLRLTLPF